MAGNNAWRSDTAMVAYASLFSTQKWLQSEIRPQKGMLPQAG
jgi:hypothetical protein